MIAAAKADGHIDAAEQKRIFAKLDEAQMDSEAKAFLMDELRKPLDIDAIVKLATTQELAVEIYTASCMAIDPDDAAEQAYLAMLAARLKLMPELKAAIEKEVAALAGLRFRSFFEQRGFLRVIKVRASPCPQAPPQAPTAG